MLWANHGARWGANHGFSPFEGLMITYPFFLDSDCVCGVLGLFFFPERNGLFCMLDIPDSVGST